MKTIMLVIHFIGLAMGIGTGIGHIFLGMATSKMEKNEAIKFTLNAFALSKMGTIGIIFLILSGIFLIIPYWPTITAFPYLIVKLCLVGLLVIIILIINSLSMKARHSLDPAPYLKKIRKLFLKGSVREIIQKK